ncbi:gp53 [Bacillus phage G]|uniref:Gp53 n=1 Tax=Bacillus phage G TaxID=2884420 RepID=G3MBC3_9CAUD|nr:gp53 [Bacillus phage G]AEO93324.1 gp53 [Bacillus phage G]
MKRLVKAEQQSSTIKLMHGTSSKLAESIFENGLLPQGLTDTKMFNYSDYGREGDARHIECVYLTDDLENAVRYANNAVKHKGGFPLIFEVEVEKSALTWDDDAFYKNYGDFDFGEKDEESGTWIKKPSKQLWEQSLTINNQCAHYGKIERDSFKRINLNSKWINIYNFIRIYNSYDKMNLKPELLKEKEEYYYKEFSLEIDDNLKLMASIIDRNIFLYNLEIVKSLDKFEKQAFSLILMEFLKDNLKEFGAKIFYTSDFKSLNFNPKISSLNYAFGRFEINSLESILDHVQLRIQRMDEDSIMMSKIVNCEASEEEFDLIYEYSIDFSGDLIEFCEKSLQMDNDSILDVLKRVKHQYNDAYNELDAEIEYLLYRDHK